MAATPRANPPTVKTVLASTIYTYAYAMTHGVSTVHADYADRQDPILERFALLALNNQYLVEFTKTRHDVETLRQCHLALTALSLSAQVKGATFANRLTLDDLAKLTPKEAAAYYTLREGFAYVALYCRHHLEDIAKLQARIDAKGAH